jgi:hypothetical protein
MSMKIVSSTVVPKVIVFPSAFQTESVRCHSGLAAPSLFFRSYIRLASRPGCSIDQDLWSLEWVWTRRDNSRLVLRYTGFITQVQTSRFSFFFFLSFLFLCRRNSADLPKLDHHTFPLVFNSDTFISVYSSVFLLSTSFCAAGRDLARNTRQLRKQKVKRIHYNHPI